MTFKHAMLHVTLIKLCKHKNFGVRVMKQNKAVLSIKFGARVLRVFRLWSALLW